MPSIRIDDPSSKSLASTAHLPPSSTMRVEGAPLPRAAASAASVSSGETEYTSRERQKLERDLFKFGKFLTSGKSEWKMSAKDMALVTRYAKHLADPAGCQQVIAEIQAASGRVGGLHNALQEVFAAIKCLPDNGWEETYSNAPRNDDSPDKKSGYFRAQIKNTYLDAQVRKALAGKHSVDPGVVQEFKTHHSFWNKSRMICAVIGVALLATAALCASGVVMPLVGGILVGVGILVVTGVLGVCAKAVLSDWEEWIPTRERELIKAVATQELKSIGKNRKEALAALEHHFAQMAQAAEHVDALVPGGSKQPANSCADERHVELEQLWDLVKKIAPSAEHVELDFSGSAPSA